MQATTNNTYKSINNPNTESTTNWHRESEPTTYQHRANYNPTQSQLQTNTEAKQQAIGR